MVGSALLLLIGAADLARAEGPTPPAPEPTSAPPAGGKPPKPQEAAKLPGAAKAPEPEQAIQPEQVRGIVRPAVRPNRAWGAFAAALLFVPRKTVELIFLASGTAAGLVRDQQVVPRVEELFSPSSGEITIFPTLFLASRQNPSAGVRVIGRADPLAASLSFGVGGLHDLNGEARLRFAVSRPLPIAVDVEGLYDIRSGLQYLGLGQQPDRDCRNHFVGLGPDAQCRGDSLVRSSRARDPALYLERRARAIVSLGVRPTDNFEIFLSSSFLHSSVEDSPSAGNVALSKVFVPTTVAASSGSTHQFYTELAIRYDTRLSSGRPSTGGLLEGYGGLARGTGDDLSTYFRVGGRAALFVPILKQSNILSPQVALDGLAPATDARVPFTDLVSQPEFRGFDTRRDYFSALVTLDYRWSLMRYLAARLFVDAASVASSPSRIFDAPPRIAAGFGVDLFGESALLGQLAFSFSHDGFRVLLSFGLPPGFGDRQHRY